ncbi:MAG: hypothetical protein SNJ71_06860, partial [Bacteroidales bacterium]
NRVSSADTTLRAIKELATQNTAFTSKQDLTYEFNINSKLNTLNIKSLLLPKQLEKASTLVERAYKLLNDNGIKINRSRMDAASYSKEIIKVIDTHRKLFYIRAN